MSLLAALEQVYAIQRSISITSPLDSNTTISIARVYRYIPRESDALSSTPCIVNTWTLLPEQRYPGWREIEYDIRMQLAVKNANQDSAAWIATAFLDPILTAFDSNISIHGSVSHHDITGGNPTLVGFMWAGVPYVGLDLHLHLYLKDFPTFSA